MTATVAKEVAVELFKLNHYGHFHMTNFQFLGWATLSFNASGLMDNKLVCDRVVANVSVYYSVGKTKLTGYSYS